jgi:HSP20 family protein
MALVTWQPVRELDSLQGEVNRLFDAFFGNGNGSGAGRGAGRRWIPAMDLVEKEDSFVLKADLPGLGRDDVEIEVKDGVLTIAGERKAEHEDSSEGYYRVERSFGTFSRTLALPKGINPDDVAASFDNGVLEVRIPKPVEQAAHKIEIGASEPPAIEGSAEDADRG